MHQRDSSSQNEISQELPHRIDGAYVLFNCPYCREELKSRTMKAGKKDSCGICGTEFVCPGVHALRRIEDDRRKAELYRRELWQREQRRRQQEMEEAKRRRAAEREDAGFLVWWPQTKQGQQIWILILGATMIVGGLYGWKSAVQAGDDPEGPAFIRALSNAGGWYFVLVIVRYIAYWFTEGREK